MDTIILASAFTGMGGISIFGLLVAVIGGIVIAITKD